MRIHKRHYRLNNMRVHGGRVKSVVRFNDNVQKLTKSFNNILGKKKSTFFNLKL